MEPIAVVFLFNAKTKNFEATKNVQDIVRPLVYNIKSIYNYLIELGFLANQSEANNMPNYQSGLFLDFFSDLNGGLTKNQTNNKTYFNIFAGIKDFEFNKLLVLNPDAKNEIKTIIESLIREHCKIDVQGKIDIVAFDAPDAPWNFDLLICVVNN